MTKWEIRAKAFITSCGDVHMPREAELQLKAEIRHLAAMQHIRIVITPYNEKEEEEERRSAAQNRYYHKCLDIICDHTGDNHLELHEKLKVELLGRPYVLKDREVIIVPSTKDLTTKTFGDYLEKVFKFAAEMGIVLPTPTNG